MITDNRLYRQDLEWVSDYIDFPDGARVLITGATGLIGSFLMDAMIARRLSGGAALLQSGLRYGRAGTGRSGSKSLLCRLKGADAGSHLQNAVAL